MSEFQQNQHQISQSGDQVQDTQLSQAGLVAALLFSFLMRQGRLKSLKTEVSAGKEKETVEVAIDSQVDAQPSPEPKPEAFVKQSEQEATTLSLDLDNSPSSDSPAPSESKPSLTRFTNSVHRRNDLQALASRQAQGRDREHESPQETKETQNSDLER